MSTPPREVVRRLAERGFGHLYVDGGKTIQGFLGEGLIQRLIITKVPVLIGTGIPLFGPLPHDVRLRHIETRQFENGLVQSEYEVLGDVA
jgi:dihydrofolate reductase